MSARGLFKTPTSDGRPTRWPARAVSQQPRRQIGGSGPVSTTVLNVPRLKRALRLGFAALLAAVALPVGAASAQPAGLEVALNQSKIDTSVGRVLTLETRIVNHSSVSTGPLVAHVNVASTDGTYVDLEDWSAEVTQQVELLEPNADTTLTWELQAVNAGSFHVYVVVLPDSGPPAVSLSTRVTVGQKRTLSAGGALPVAIVVPLLLGLAAAAVRYRARRRTA